MRYTDAASIVSEGGKKTSTLKTPLSVDHCTPVKSEHAEPLFPWVNNSNRFKIQSRHCLIYDDIFKAGQTIFYILHKNYKCRFLFDWIAYFWSLSCLKFILVSLWFTRKCSTTIRKLVYNFYQTIFIFSNSQRCMTPSLKTACVTWS